jgi:hypothetical protein
MMWLIGAAVVAVGAAFWWQSRRPKTFSYRGRKYTRHGDGSYTYGDGAIIVDDGERQEVADHYESTHDSSSSDGGSDGGDGGGGGGGD